MRPMGPRPHRGASPLVLVGIACLTIFFHLFLLRSNIEHRLKPCPTESPKSDTGTALLLQQFQTIEEKLDTLRFVDSPSSNASNILLSIQRQFQTLSDDVKRLNRDGTKISVFGDSISQRINSRLKQAAISDVPLPSDRKKVRLFVGVFTGINDSGRKEMKSAEEKLRYDYRRRRAALRETWFPDSRAKRERLEKESGIIVRFVVGHSSDPIEEAKLADEERNFGDFLRVPLVESYYGLTNKTKTFMATAFSLYDPDWVVKVDDDVYYMIERTLLAMDQWDKMGATYVGCMKHGHVWATENSRWHEPQHLLFGGDYFLHAYGSIYAMHRTVVENVILRNFNSLRIFANEDVTVGSWMLGQNVVHFEDMRLCATKCSEAAIGILRNECAGLCNPLKDLYLVHHAKSCQGPPKIPLPYLPSYPEHTEFEKMRV